MDDLGFGGDEILTEEYYKGEEAAAPKGKGKARPAPQPSSYAQQEPYDAYEEVDEAANQDEEHRVAHMGKQKLKYEKYWRRFSELLKKGHLTKKSGKALEKCSMEELDLLILEIEDQLSTQGQSEAMFQGVLFSADLLERVSRKYPDKVPVKVSAPMSLKVCVAQDKPVWMDILDELAIKYGWSGMGPEWRLLMLAARTVGTVHAVNTNPDLYNKMMRPVDEEPGEEDL